MFPRHDTTATRLALTLIPASSHGECCDRSSGVLRTVTDGKQQDRDGQPLSLGLAMFQRLPQNLRRMLRFSACQVFDLLAARNARCHDLNFSARSFNRRSQAAIADRQRQIVVFFFEAERSRPCRSNPNQLR